MTAAWIALGSNLQAPLQQLRRAVRALDRQSGLRLERLSSIYRSAALGPGEQPTYLNAVVLVHTSLAPLTLLDALQHIERQQGRERTLRWGPRTLDLDLLLYGSQSMHTGRLTLPHPAMTQRNFVLVPMAEIAAADLRLPDGTRLDTLVSGCPLDGLAKTHWQLRE
ncbi:MAG: 2-amino-4-hydroxy-6-hydroxymethyldihydropteridine diphosphokinase [Halioglobus sp.]|nr:2-amino-4-hydroxy-6-hydroxymethyldihydropteridine diphosphokinase [Halioglobus sp.]